MGDRVKGPRFDGQGKQIEPGQVLATAEVLDRSRAAFETEALPPFSVKGKAKPVQAYGVGPLATGGRIEESFSDFPLVGRGEELDALRTALAQAEKGSGRVIEIVGEPKRPYSSFVKGYETLPVRIAA
jgi:hypothetical protein